MTFEEYQQKSRKTALYPKVEGKGWIYPALGLASEAGEVGGKLKKVIRDTGGEIDAERKNDIADELGDVLWYVAQLATELDLQMGELAQANIDKLYSRLDRGKIQGSGDKR